MNHNFIVAIVTGEASPLSKTYNEMETFVLERLIKLWVILPWILCYHKGPGGSLFPGFSGQVKISHPPDQSHSQSYLCPRLSTMIVNSPGEVDLSLVYVPLKPSNQLIVN